MIARLVRAVQIVNLEGPDRALELVDVPEPEPSHMLTPGSGVVVDVHAAGVSFPEVLQTRGQYQLKPPLPFVPGSEVAGVVRSAPDGAAVKPGDRVAAFCALGAFAEVAVAPEFLTFPLPGELDFAQGAALVLNYHTAYFALKLRGRLAEGETVLVHGAAGGVGTAALQVARGLGARTIAVVSTDEKERVAREAGAGEVLRADGPWKDQAKELSGGGVDVVLDPVGGDRFTDSLRSLAEGGRAVVVGFTGGSIPEVRVNRLLLGNTEVVGAGWGAYAMGRPDVCREIGAALDGMIERGIVRPPVGARFPLERAAEALKLIDGRGATGKVVLDLGA
ncbi:MAG TPA: NADPH:quinone oxidoreductase family protein [Solirubrobacteraceae bacterium]|jgi:NADPH2:quinone reductase|nr:NADPH:quinone oxidoreductase family protein [Solirubrobacteraceae bacterium]